MASLLDRDGVRLALLLALFVGLRCVSLTADPPAGLVSYYQDFAFSVFDEGWWTANARQWALTGELRGTGFDLFWVSPVFSLGMAPAFAVFGPSLGVARLVSIAFGAAGVVALWWIGRRETGRDRDAGHLAALLWTVSFAAAQLGRLATPESTGLAFALAGAATMLTGRPLGLVAAGTCAALAALTKPQFGVLLPSFLLAAAVLAVRHRRSTVQALAWTALGVAIPAAIWLGFVSQHGDEAAALFRFYGKDRWFASASDLAGGLAVIKPAVQLALAGVVYRHLFLVALPGVFLLAAIAVPRVASAIVAPRRATDVSDAAILFGIWALVGGALVSTVPFQPLRYYFPFAPALVFLAAWLLTSPSEAEDASSAARRRVRAVLRVVAGLFVFTQLAYAVFASVLPAFLLARTTTHVALFHPEEFRLTAFLLRLAKARSLAPFADIPYELAYVAALALCAVLAVLAGGALTVGFGRPLVRGLPLPAAIGRRVGPILAAILLLQALHWIRWIPERATTLPEMGQQIARLVPRDALVSPAGTYSLESTLRFDSSAVLAGGMFDASGRADYFVALVGHPLIGRMPDGEIERRWPGSVREASFELTGGYRYDLYRAARGETER